MKIVAGIFFLVVLLNATAFAQERLIMYPSFGSVHFEYEKDTAVFQVTPKQVSQILFDHPQALKEFKRARRSSTWAGVVGFIGAGLVILPAATAAAGGDPEWTYAAGGAALLAASIPLSLNYRKKAQHALDLFNERRKGATLQPRANFYVMGTGAKLVIRF